MLEVVVAALLCWQQKAQSLCVGVVGALSMVHPSLTSVCMQQNYSTPYVLSETKK